MARCATFVARCRTQLKRPLGSMAMSVRSRGVRESYQQESQGATGREHNQFPIG